MILLSGDSCGKKGGFWSQNSLNFAIGHLNNTISVWSVSKNAFNSVCGIEQVRKIAIGTFPQCMVNAGGSLFITGKDKWVRKVNVHTSVVEWAVQLADHCHEMLWLGEESFLCCLKNGDIVRLEGHDEGEVTKIGSDSNISYSCGINPKSFLTGQQLLMVNHRNTKETEINRWTLKPME